MLLLGCSYCSVVVFSTYSSAWGDFVVRNSVHLSFWILYLATVDRQHDSGITLLYHLD